MNPASATAARATATPAARTSSAPARPRRHRRRDHDHRRLHVPGDERRLPAGHRLRARVPRAVRRASLALERRIPVGGRGSGPATAPDVSQPSVRQTSPNAGARGGRRPLARPAPPGADHRRRPPGGAHARGSRTTTGRGPATHRQRQLDRDGWRGRRDAHDAARVLPWARDRRELARDLGRPRVLRDHEASPQRPLRVAGRRWRARGRRARALRPGHRAEPRMAAAHREARGHRLRPRPATGRPGRPARRARRPSRLAMPHRVRGDERVDGPCLGVRAAVRRGRTRVCLLASRVRPGLGRSRVVARDPALHRPVRTQEPRAGAVRGPGGVHGGRAHRRGRRRARPPGAEPGAHRP